MRQAIRDVNPNQPILQVATMEQRVATSMARQRLVMGAFNVFAVVALLLATIGIYGVLAGGVIEQTKEIAVRTALGASRARIIGQVGRQAIGMAAIGMVVGGARCGGDQSRPGRAAVRDVAARRRDLRRRSDPAPDGRCRQRNRAGLACRPDRAGRRSPVALTAAREALGRPMSG